MIDTRLVYGFLDAGKTSHIQDCIFNDYFYKHGSTLILCFEQGETGYDADLLRERNTQIAYYEGGEAVREFCLSRIGEYNPDRIYVEMNSMMPGLRDEFPDCMQVTYTVTWIDWSTMEIYFNNFRQMINQMVSESQQITFRGCPSKELLAPYSQAFRLMNHKASYLRQDPMGFHERAFDLFVPYSLDEQEIAIPEAHYLPFWLDAMEHPEHYEGKKIRFTDPLELRRNADDTRWMAGRVVMTCCMADLQFMSFELTEEEPDTLHGGWITFEACSEIGTAEYGRRVLKLRPLQTEYAQAPKDLILTQV